MAYNNYRSGGGNQGGNYRGGQGNQGGGGGGGYQRQQPQGNQNGPKVDWKAHRIGGMFWHKNGKGFSGRVTIDGVTTQIVIYENSLKQDGETTPDFWIHSAPDQGQGSPAQSRPAPQRQGNNGGGFRQGQARPQQTRRAPQQQYQDPVNESPVEPDFQEGDGPQNENADF